ncbi:aldo/keto reductase [Geobacter argillaceus]|uniref:Aryl-alcohol dehydrogenase-like predicted oxidoreductase n=1 Tax=Geobacter argillaceus TaxID=345631 RepID=A0A562VG45_9BACT|nr:aldo/keto reductase [Geobacter argillaceus]TWJ16687.1 aryl-alcohol dehydrogenase-like predicted oxidoreductase [Geobacter argillaceus]
MNHVALGATNISFFPLVFGTLPLGPLQAGLSPTEGGRLIRHALERGVTMIDTATLYGTYPHVREGIAGWRNDVTIVTKTHANDGPTARADVEMGLRELGCERLDIVHIHGARVADPFSDRAEVLAELLRMKEEGKIGHVGLSSHFISAIRKAADHPEIEVIHPLINRTGMGILDGSSAEMADAIAACAKAGKGVYAMKALAGGNLISEARASLAYVRGLEGVHGVAIGMLSEAEVEANVALFSGNAPEDKVWRKLESRRRKLRIMENFCKGCGACVETCGSGALSIVNGKAVLDEAACILCGYCGASCPEFIIRVV